MFAEQDYRFQVERHHDQVRYAEQQELLKQLPKSVGMATRFSQTVRGFLGKELSKRREQLRSHAALLTPQAKIRPR